MLPEFESFPDIKKLGSAQLSITQKIHGCLSSDTWITMADGSRKRIKEIVESSEDCFVLGFYNGELVPSKILNKFNNGISEEWLTVKVSNNGLDKYREPKNIEATPNHKFFVKNKGYVEAKNLTIGDKLIGIRPEIKLTFFQEQVLIGKMLGDGSFSNKSVGFGHKISHVEYLDYTLNCLGWIGGKRQKNVISGYGSEMCRARSKSLDSIHNIFNAWVFSGVKHVPENLNLTPISLAFWYMDDGSLCHTELQEDRATFATNGFDKKDLVVLTRELEKFGIKAEVFESNGFRIRLNKNSADILFTLISPYIPPVMQYKLPQRYKGLQNFKIPDYDDQFDKPILEQEVLNVFKKQLRKSDKNKYDIETETHNFFADNILVHNSNAQVYIYQDPTQPSGLNLVCGSRTRWIAPGDDNYGFAEMVHANKEEFLKLGPGRHFGEWAGPGINSGEGLKQKYFILFDFWKYPPERPLPPNTMVVPVLYLGEFNLGKVEECMNDLKTNGSKLVPGFMRPEGCVVRIKGERYKVVFQAEDAKWKQADPEYQKQKNDAAAVALAKYGHLLQPIRLEKLLSRDERYLKDYPKTMGEIVKDYFADLIKENQVEGNDVEVNGIRKQLAGNIFKFVQEIVEKQQNAQG